jgi:hypothetical protein
MIHQLEYISEYIDEKEKEVAKLKRYYRFQYEHGYWPHEIQKIVLKPVGRVSPVDGITGTITYHSVVFLKTGEVKHHAFNVREILNPDKWIDKK